MPLASILDCARTEWSPGLGDPSTMGWVTVAVDAAAALLAALVTWRAPFPVWSRGRERAFWTLAAILQAFLAVNKQLDLQSLLTANGRCTARAQGWYEGRRAVQGAFVLGLILAAGMVFQLLLALLRGTWRRSFLPLLGLAFVLGFVLVRAVGFHWVDRLLGIPAFAGFRANWVLELSGPLLVCFASVALLAARR